MPRASSVLSRRSFALGAISAVACSRNDPARAPIAGHPAGSTSDGRSTDVTADPSDASAGSDSPVLDAVDAAADTAASAARAPGGVRALDWDLGPQPWGAGRAVVIVPEWGTDGDRFPVVVALHGRGEALKGPAQGAWGWPRDYAMLRAFDRLRDPPLVASDFEGFVDPDHLAETNARLAREPFRGVIVACPYLPDVRPPYSGDIAAFTRFVHDALLPRVRNETPAMASAEATGIDGVSLGGAVALRIGLAAPDQFGAVSATQPALGDDRTAEWTSLARRARARNPALALRLVTSSEDYFRRPILDLDRAWTAAGLRHDFQDLLGPHDYPFNRGPGSLELLLWHDRVLRT